MDFIFVVFLSIWSSFKFFFKHEEVKEPWNKYKDNDVSYVI